MDRTDKIDKDAQEAVEYTGEGEMDMNIDGTEEQQEKLLNVWISLCEFQFDKPGNSYLFIMRVMNILRFNNDLLDNRDAQVGMLEYLKFIYLKGRQLLHGNDPDRFLPSPKMDLIWREHLLYTEKYRELCNGVRKNLGLPEDDAIFHREHPRWIESGEYSQRYEETLDAYKTVFGDAPSDWWPVKLENETTLSNFYDGILWCVEAFYDKGEYVYDPDLSTVKTRHPLRLTEEGKNLTANSTSRKLSGEQFAELVDAMVLPEGLAELYQKETLIPMEKVLEYLHEYKKFLWIAYFRPECAVPSGPVDMLWHMHVISTKSYDTETKKLFGRYMDHTPGGGTKEEKAGYAKATSEIHEYLDRFFEDGFHAEAWPTQDIKDNKYLSLFSWRSRVKPQSL